MTTGAETSAGEMPSATPSGEDAAAASPAPPEFISRKDFESFTKKLNGELAALRKARSDVGQATNGHARPAEPESTSGTAQRDADETKWKQFREMGKLEAKLGDDLVEQFGEEYDSMPNAQKLMFLRAAVKLRGETPTTEARGEMPAKAGARRPQSSRAEAPAPRESVPRPRSQQEFAEMQKKDPKAASELLARDDFNPQLLPWNAPR